MNHPPLGAPEIVLTVAAGQSPTPMRVFRPGEPVQPVALGSGSAWRIFADGVARTHLFVAFDGTTLFVSGAVAEAPVLLAGVPVGRDWTPVRAPTDLRFGAAILSVTTRMIGADLAPRSAAEHTVHDGGALFAAAQRALQQAGSSQPPPPGQATGQRALDASAARQLGGPSYAAPRPVDYRTPLSPPLVAAPHANGYDASAYGAQRPATPAKGFTGSAPPPAVTPDAQAPSIAHALTEQTVVKKKPGAWESASPVKKITFVMFPVVIVLAGFMLMEPEPAPQENPQPSTHASAKPVTSSASATPVAVTTPAPSNAPAPSAPPPAAELDAAVAVAPFDPARTPLASAAPAPPPQKLPKGATPKETRTPERIALDTAAAGSFVEAARLYDALATAHPDDPTYKDAARILRERLSRGE